MYDVLVIGAGQAGLATARMLSELQLDYVVHERHARIGDSWRARFDSLVLFTSREISALPNLPQTGNALGFPSKDEMAAYLERYSKHFELPITKGNAIVRLVRDQTSFKATTERGQAIEGRAVIVATGGFQRPRIPEFAAALSEEVRQFDVDSYRNPSATPEGHIVVVGDGASGRQIALELASCRKVSLASGHRRQFAPQRIFGRDSSWWSLQIGLLTADKTTIAGRMVRAVDATPGLHLRSSTLRKAGIEILPKCVDAKSNELYFADGSQRKCDAVIWAVGYRDETDWLNIEYASEPSRVLEVRGVSPVSGLFYVGRDWQTCRASGLVCGVHRDAELIARQAKDYLDQNV